MPFCEEVQSAEVEEQKQQSLIPAEKKQPKLIHRILGAPERPEIWGGVGIACIDWNQIKPNLLAAVTLKTNMLEVWDIEQGTMVNIHELPRPVQMIKWSPHREDLLLAVADKASKLFLVDY